jgi:hypothetical protein
VAVVGEALKVAVDVTVPPVESVNVLGL